jgi:hypothetical protein
MSPDLARWGVLLHESARLHTLRAIRGELPQRAARAADGVLARAALEHFRARWVEWQWLASDFETPAPAEVLERARSRFPPPNALGEEDESGWVYQRLAEGCAAAEIDAQVPRRVPRA